MLIGNIKEITNPLYLKHIDDSGTDSDLGCHVRDAIWRKFRRDEDENAST